MAEIIADRLTRFLDPSVHLRSGIGNGVNGTIDVCINQAADWLSGGDGKTDAPMCVDPVIARFVIRLNDAAHFDVFRDELKPYAVRIVNTRGDDALSRKRAYACVDWAVREIAPLAFDAWATLDPDRADEARAYAKKLRAVAPIIDPETAQAGRAVAREVYAYAYVYAADASAAYASAAAASASASAAAYSASSASSAATRAAYAATRAAYANERQVWDASLRHLDALIAMTV